MPRCDSCSACGSYIYTAAELVGEQFPCIYQLFGCVCVHDEQKIGMLLVQILFRELEAKLQNLDPPNRNAGLPDVPDVKMK